MTPFDLSVIPSVLHGNAQERIAANDGVGLLYLADNTQYPQLIASNIRFLSQQDWFEAMLVAAWTGTRTNNHNHYRFWEDMFLLARPARLMAAGGPIPTTTPSHLYRGASSPEGFSWTADKARAEWFATRWDQSHPVYTIRYEDAADKILFYTDARDEQEYVLWRRSNKKARRMTPTPEQIQQALDNHHRPYRTHGAKVRDALAHVRRSRHEKPRVAS